MDDRKALFGALAAAVGDGTGDRYESLITYVKRHSSRSDDLNLSEVFEALSKKEHLRLWERALAVVSPIVEERRFLPRDEYEQAEAETGGEDAAAAAGVAGDDSTPGNPETALAADGTGTPPRPSTPDTAAVEPVPRRPRRGAVAAVAEAAVSSEEEEGRSSGKKGGQGCVSQALEVLKAVATLAQEFLSDSGRVAPRPLLETAAYLHGIVLSLQGLQGDALQRVIAKVCEMWWTQERPGGEHLVAQLLPLMLVRSIDEDAKEADVKRMYGLRAALLLLDFDDDSSEQLRTLLLRTFISPLYLKSSEGKRLLAYMFGLHPSLVADIHSVMKAQIPGAKRTVLAAYGEVYFKVWRGAEGTYLEKVEMHCLQDLMHACIHASTPKMHGNLLLVLDGLHSQKRVKGVDAALLRLYGPVLWRALRVANPTVRAQACHILVEAFPLQDPNAGAAAYDAMLQQQFDALTRLLEDGHPQVRAVAAKGACRVLSVYWEVVPMPTTRALLARVVGRLASDGASPLVRLGAVEGLSLLLDCPASHNVLKAMLPGVSNLIHDTNKKVRVAFVSLLGRVKGVRAIKYYHVVPVDHILARLSEDHLKCPLSASGLTKLILNSYFPTGGNITGSVQVARCLTLLSQEEGAATAFYSRLHQHAGVPSAAKMLAMLVRCSVVAARADDTTEEEEEHDDEDKVEAGRKGRRGRGGKNGKRKGLDDGEGGNGGPGWVLKASDSKVMSAVLGLIATIWESMLPALEKSVNEPSLELVQQTVTGEALAILHRRFSGDGGCRAAFMRVAGLAGGDLAPGMLEEVVVEMLALPADALPSVYGPTVDLLCSWGQHEHLVAAILDSLQRVFSSPMAAGGDGGGINDGSDMSSTSGSRGKRRRPVSADNGHTGPRLPPALALSMLSHVLAGGYGHASTTAARDAIMADDAAVGNLEAVFSLARATVDKRLSLMTNPKAAAAGSKAARSAEDRRRQCPDGLLVRAVEALGRVYMHREAVLVGDVHSGACIGRAEEADLQATLLPMPFSIKMRELMVWTTNTILPVLTGNGYVGVGFGNTEPRDGTPVKSAGGGMTSMVAETPSPMPPPRSRLRGDDSDTLIAEGDRVEGDGGVADDGNAGAGAPLAQGIVGVVVLLASEWVEVGSGLAEISLRADTWGNRILGLLLQDGVNRDCVVAILPQLCRLNLQLSNREPQGARPPASIWEVLLRCADCRVYSKERETEEVETLGATCVQKYMAASVALGGRKGGLSGFSERLLTFMFTQTSTVEGGGDGGDGGEEEVDSTDDNVEEERNAAGGASIEQLARLQTRSPVTDDGKDLEETSLLTLSRPAAAVFAGLLRSASASKAAAVFVLSHLSVFRPSDTGSDASWPLFCVHVLGALIEHAPGKARLEIAADAHSELKAAAAASKPIAEDLEKGSNANGNDSGSGEEGRGGGGGEEVAGEISTKKAAAWAVVAIFERLEAARRAAMVGGRAVAASGGDGGVEESKGGENNEMEVSAPTAAVAVSA